MLEIDIIMAPICDEYTMIFPFGCITMKQIGFHCQYSSQKFAALCLIMRPVKQTTDWVNQLYLPLRDLNSERSVITRYDDAIFVPASKAIKIAPDINQNLKQKNNSWFLCCRHLYYFMPQGFGRFLLKFVGIIQLSIIVCYSRGKKQS